MNQNNFASYAEMYESPQCEYYSMWDINTFIYIVNTVVYDDLVPCVARASAAISWTHFIRNISVSAPVALSLYFFTFNIFNASECAFCVQVVIFLALMIFNASNSVPGDVVAICSDKKPQMYHFCCSWIPLPFSEICSPNQPPIRSVAL